MHALPIPIPTEPLQEFCQRNHIRRLAVFGSALRNDFRPDSDIDLLVEFDPNTRPACSRWRDWSANYQRFSTGAKSTCALKKTSAATFEMLWWRARR